MTMQEYRAENPGLDHVPDSEVERLLDYRGWLLNKALGQLGNDLLEGLRQIPLIGRIFRND